jgi:hypothetical protein
MYFPAFTVKQGRRNRGGGGQAPPSFAKCPFSGSKVPFSCVKNVLRIAFFCPKGTFENLNLCYFLGKFYSFVGKIWYIREILGCIRKIFVIFRKKCDISAKKILVYPENFFETPTPVANFSGKKILDALLYSESAPQSLPPPTFRSFLCPCSKISYQVKV